MVRAICSPPIRLTMSPKIEKVATTGIGSSAQLCVGKASDTAKVLAVAKRVRRDSIVILSGFKMAARQGLGDQPPDRTENDGEPIANAGNQNDRGAGRQGIVER